MKGTTSVTQRRVRNKMKGMALGEGKGPETGKNKR